MTVTLDIHDEPLMVNRLRHRRRLHAVLVRGVLRASLSWVWNDAQVLVRSTHLGKGRVLHAPTGKIYDNPRHILIRGVSPRDKSVVLHVKGAGVRTSEAFLRDIHSSLPNDVTLRTVRSLEHYLACDCVLCDLRYDYTQRSLRALVMDAVEHTDLQVDCDGDEMWVVLGSDPDVAAYMLRYGRTWRALWGRLYLEGAPGTNVYATYGEGGTLFKVLAERLEEVPEDIALGELTDNVHTVVPFR
jgi:hypothetical protein